LRLPAEVLWAKLQFANETAHRFLMGSTKARRVVNDDALARKRTQPSGWLETMNIHSATIE